MPLSDIVAVIAKTNKISLGFFVITCILLSYELYLYLKDKKGTKKPSIPLFKKGPALQPLSTHTAKPVPTPPAHTGAVPKMAPIPPLISQMSPPSKMHSPAIASKKKKMSRGAKVTIGATAALTVLTIGIAWKLNQSSSQQAGLTSQNAKASEQLTPDVPISTNESSASAATNNLSPSPIPSESITGTTRTLIPTITPRHDLVDLTSGKTGNGFEGVATTTPTLSPSPDETPSTDSAEIAALPATGGASDAATLAPTLPIAGTIQYSIGLLVVASVIVLASLIF